MSTTVGNPYLSSTAASAVGPWIDMYKHQWDGNDCGFSFHFEETAGTGTITIEASNDPRCNADNDNGTSTANYDDISASITSPAIPAVAGAGDGFINVSNFRMRFVRYRWAYSANNGVHTVYAYVT